MNHKRTISAILLLFAIVVGISIVHAQTASFVSHQSFRGDIRTIYGSNYQTYWPQLSDPLACVAREDIIIQVSPAGCQPVVVRSDLLAEQNVPVFCQLDALKINPLVDIKQIRNIRFRAEYPPGVLGVGFHPARAALRTQTSLAGDPLINNIGYIVVVLQKNEVEDNLPDFLNFTLHAQVDYNTVGGFGIGAAEFLLKEQSDDEFFGAGRNRQSFWQGRYFVRLDDANANEALVSIYEGDRKISSVRVETRGVSQEIYVPGLYCQAGVQVAYDGFIAAMATARISVDNDILEVHQGSNFLNNKCRVINIEAEGVNKGNVQVYCGNERITLRLGERNYNRGDLVLYDKAGADGNFQGNELYEVQGRNEDGTFEISLDKGKNNETADITQIRPDDDNSLKEITYGENTEREFKNAVDNFERVANEYPFERIAGTNLTETYGEQALIQGIEMSRRFGKQFTEARLVEKYIETYPNSKDVGMKSNRLSDLYTKDYTLAGVAVDIDNEVHNLVLLDFSISNTVARAHFEWGAQNFDVALRNKTEIDGLGEISLANINGPEDVDVSILCKNPQGEDDSPSRKSYTLRLGGVLDEKPCGQTLNLRNIEMEELAKIRLIPHTKGSATETNFTVGIGIEKRAIDLNPDKAKQKIDSLNETINRWESISDRLNNINKGLKAACFATAGALTVKNFFSGLSGESLARQRTMQGYWNQECADKEYNGEQYSSVDECYLDNADAINADVSKMQDILRETDAQIEEAERSHIQEGQGLFAQDTVNPAGSIGELKRSFANYRDVKYDSDGNGQPDAEIGTLIDNIDYDRGDFAYDQYTEVLVNAKLVKSGDPRLVQIGQERIDEIGRTIQTNRDINLKFQEDRESREAGEPVISGYMPSSSGEGRDKIDRHFDVVTRGSWSTAPPFEELGQTHYTRAELQGSDLLDEGTYVFALQETETGFSIKGVAKETKVGETKTYELIERYNNGQNIDELNKEYGIQQIKSRADLSYSNRFIEPRVKFYETEPLKGYPAIVPYDIQNGWYAAVEQDLPMFGQRGNVDASGLPTSFWICNVGEDGREQFFENRGRDVCQQINSYTGQSYDVFPNLPEDIARVKIQQGRAALLEAARKHSSGIRTIEIAGQSMPVGDPASIVPASQCQDFMSPQECNLMFNVCDPVICPSSRCDFGGTYRVPDVIQSGIVGSALLCLPNAQEGIAVPVCLTGIQAGIDSYVSILKSHQQCLQENIDTGRTVGICDLTTSIYMCDFFWRQAAPLTDALVPKLFEIASGKGGARGGGEYLTVQNAWENTQQSVDYFTQTYAVNSFEAFRSRSTSEAGTEFCRAWVSAKGPTAFESLIEPDSPVQFHAYYDSIPFNDATVPATAQYKVFYHIFAGRDQGVQYNVYLKDPPEVSFVSVPGTVQVASGFISIGAFATDTIDFTAPDGYKQLCVSVNGKEECGFKQVTTSFFLDAVKDEFASQELDRRNIQSEQECISGGTNPSALLNPNLQAGAEEAINPEVYNRGIVRICATHNPGTGTDPTRFVDRGFCGDESVRCWLDTRSLDNAVEAGNLDVRNKTITEFRNEIQEGLLESGEILPDDEITLISKSLGEELELREINKENYKKYIDIIDNTLLKTVLNWQKASLIFLKGKFYEKVANDYRAEEKPDTEKDANRPSSQTGASSEGSSGDEVDVGAGDVEIEDFRIVEEERDGREGLFIYYGFSLLPLYLTGTEDGSRVYLLAETQSIEIGEVRDERIVFDDAKIEALRTRGTDAEKTAVSTFDDYLEQIQEVEVVEPIYFFIGRQEALTANYVGQDEFTFVGQRLMCGDSETKLFLSKDGNVDAGEDAVILVDLNANERFLIIDYVAGYFRSQIFNLEAEKLISSGALGSLRNLDDENKLYLSSFDGMTLPDLEEGNIRCN